MKPELAFKHSPRLDSHARAYFSSPDPATPRNFTEEMLQTLRGYQQTGQGYFDLERLFQPQYGQLTLDQQRQAALGYDDAAGVHHPGSLELNRIATNYQRTGDMLGWDDQYGHHPGSLELSRLGTNYQRTGDIADVSTLGPEATRALLASNPLLAGTLGNLYDRTANSGLLNTLNDQAAAGLASAGDLSPQDQRTIDQDTARAFSDRGTYTGNQAIVGQVLNRDAARRARIQAAQALAGSVQGMNQSQNDFVGRAGQIFSTTLGDPFQAVLGRTSGAGGGGTGGTSSGGGYPQTIGTGSRLFDPTNPYVQDIYNSNFNAQNANNIAQANASNANTSATVSTIGSLLGALGSYYSDERLKKNVKETGEKTVDGIPIIEGEFKTDPKRKRYRMVRAQDAEKVRPDAVHTDPVSGLKMVDYWGLGTPMLEVA